jgi:hypothetical protein
VKLHGKGKGGKPHASTLELIAERMASGTAGASKSGTSKSGKSAGSSKPVGSSKTSHKQNDVRDRQSSHKDSTRRDAHDPKPRVPSHAVKRARAIWADDDEDTKDFDRSEDEDEEDDRRRSPHSHSRKSGKRNQHEEAKTPRRQPITYDYRTASQITKQSPHARKIKGDAKRWYRFWILLINAFPDKGLQLQKIKEFFQQAAEVYPEHYAVST